MDRDFLEKRKKDLNAYLQVTVLHVSDLSNIECLYCLASFCMECISITFACVPVAAEPRDGEGLSNSDSLCL